MFYADADYQRIMTAVIDSFAAEMKSLRDENGNEYIWDGSEYWKRSAPFLFRSSADWKTAR